MQDAWNAFVFHNVLKSAFGSHVILESVRLLIKFLLKKLLSKKKLIQIRKQDLEASSRF